MASEWATGKLKLVGGRLCLDFVNTVYARAVGDGLPRGTRRDGYSPGDDKLTSYGDLVAWGARAGVLSDKEARRLLRAASGQPKNSETVLKRAVKLREAIYRIFLMKLLGKRADEADLRTVNEELRAAKDHERLLPKGDGFALGWVDGDSLDRVLWPVARSVSEVLASNELNRVRQCGGENCGWLFLDTSRNRSRQWCDMRDCGNLAKVRRFRQRRQER
ncbi:MAG TPA: ABATE domain-containing protein [Pyrinomonadaceae bacterium]|nr:ABATE domain-containing protein [Pyrinomonadaceae bacterium]